MMAQARCTSKEELEFSAKSSDTRRVKRFDGVYHAPIDKLGPAGRWLRHTLLDAILVGTPVLVAVQKYRTPFLDKLMHILSFLGTEDFYTPVVVVLAWVIDARLARLFTILMGIGFYVTTYSKNLLQLPRPPVPPVQVLEKTYDWALPSLHSVIGVVLPWYLWTYTYLHYHLTTLPLVTFFCIIFFWSFSVMFSRVYLGVHNPADIVSGGMLGVLLLSIYLQVDDSLDRFISHGSNVPLQIFACVLIMLIIHPKMDNPTQSFRETVVTLSVALGVIIARTRTAGPQSFYYTALMDQNPDDMTTFSLLYKAVGRVLLGFPVILATRLICKGVVKPTAYYLCRLCHVQAYSFSVYYKNSIQLNKHYCKGFRLPPVFKSTAPAKESTSSSTSEEEKSSSEDSIEEDISQSLQFDVDIPTKIITYLVMGWVTCEYCHILFYYLGLSNLK